MKTAGLALPAVFPGLQAPRGRLELPTNRLTAGRSANWATEDYEFWPTKIQNDLGLLELYSTVNVRQISPDNLVICGCEWDGVIYARL